MSYGAPTACAPALSGRLLLGLGMRMPVARVLRCLGLTPPRAMITAERFPPEAGRCPYVPAMVQEERLWAIGDVEQSEEEPLHAGLQAFRTAVHAVEPGSRLRGARQDGGPPAQKALQAGWPPVVQGEWPLPHGRRCRRNTTRDWRPHGCSPSPRGGGDGPRSSARMPCSGSALRRGSARSSG